jgi:hypothetical protein
MRLTLPGLVRPIACRFEFAHARGTDEQTFRDMLLDGVLADAEVCRDLALAQS